MTSGTITDNTSANKCRHCKGLTPKVGNYVLSVSNECTYVSGRKLRTVKFDNPKKPEAGEV